MAFPSSATLPSAYTLPGVPASTGVVPGAALQADTLLQAAALLDQTGLVVAPLPPDPVPHVAESRTKGWTFQITDRQGVPLAELRDATSRSLRFGLNRTPTFTFQVRADHPYAQVFTTADQVLIKGYESITTGTPTLRFFGPVVGWDKTRDASVGAVGVAASGAQWRLDRRLIGQSETGATFGTTPVATVDRGELMARVVEALNAGEQGTIWTVGGDTGVRRGTIQPSSNTYVTDQRYVRAGAFLAAQSAPLDGPDWRVTPTEPVADAFGVRIGLLDVAPVFGTVKPDALWEYGGGRANVAQWKDTGDASGLCNRAVSLPTGWPDTATQRPIVWQDDAAVATRGVYEDVVPGELQSDDLRLKLAQEHVRIRQTPRRVIAFTPISEDPQADADTRRVPRLFADFEVGDTMPFRASESYPVFDQDGTVIGVSLRRTVDVLFRCFAAQVDIDDNGVAVTSLALQDDSA